MPYGYYEKFYSTFKALKQTKVLHTHGKCLLAFNVFKLFENPDVLDNTNTGSKVLKNDEETGMDRLKMMFKPNEYGDISIELEQVSQGTIMGFFTGSMLGGTLHSKDSYIKFMEQNQATVFESHLDAKKRLQDKVLVGFARGAWMWGWRVAFFVGSLTLFTTTISVYRGKSSLIEYTSAGAITGMLYKLKNGPKPMVAGGIAGGILGTIGGSVALGILYLTGTSMEDIRYWQYKWKEEYSDSQLEKLKKKREQDMNPLIRSHEETSKDNLLEMLEENLQGPQKATLSNNSNQANVTISKSANDHQI